MNLFIYSDSLTLYYSMWSFLPKTKKKLRAFFTDESGKITKENILTMGVWGMILAGFIVENSTAQSHMDGPSHDSGATHTSGAGGHVSVGHISSPLAWGHASGGRNGSVSSQPSGGHLSSGHVSWTTHSNNPLGHASSVSHSNYMTGDDGA